MTAAAPNHQPNVRTQRSLFSTQRLAVVVSLFTTLLLAGCDGDGGGQGGQSTGGGGTGGTGAAAGGGTGGSTGGSGGSTGGTAGTGGATGNPCGGIAGLTCADGEYCDYNDTCGEDDQAGHCVPIPEACDLDCPSVCGCDGKVYCNACIAAQAGVDVAPGSNCTGTDNLCGGIDGLPCGDNEYCDYLDDPVCGLADAWGICLPIPEVCPKDCPGVCGCDGQFYCNSCEAAKLGIDTDPTITCSQ